MKKKIYVVTLVYGDAELKSFYNKEKAIACAKEMVNRFRFHLTDYEELDCDELEGFVYYANNVADGESIYVIESEMEDEL